jgi:hypothetical protein
MLKYLTLAEWEESNRLALRLLQSNRSLSFSIEDYPIPRKPLPKQSSIAWRPQVACIVKFRRNHTALESPKLVAFMGQLMTRSALSIFVNVVSPDMIGIQEVQSSRHRKLIGNVLMERRLSLQRTMMEEKVDGFAKVRHYDCGNFFICLGFHCSFCTFRTAYSAGDYGVRKIVKKLLITPVALAILHRIRLRLPGLIPNHPENVRK